MLVGRNDIESTSSLGITYKDLKPYRSGLIKSRKVSLGITYKDLKLKGSTWKIKGVSKFRNYL